MAFAEKEAGCPFCGSTDFKVSLFVNDMPFTDEPSEAGEELDLICSECGKAVFAATRNQGGQISAVGVSICRKCKDGFPETTHPVGTKNCPKCSIPLEKRWWRGRGYTV